MFFFVLRYLSSNFKNEMMIPTDSSEFKCHHHCHHHHLHNYNNHLSHHNFHHNHHNHHYHYDYHNNNGNNNRVIIMIIIIIIIIIIILSSCLMWRSVKDLVAHPQVLCSQNCICLMNSYPFIIFAEFVEDKLRACGKYIYIYIYIYILLVNYGFLRVSRYSTQKLLDILYDGQDQLALRTA